MISTAKDIRPSVVLVELREEDPIKGNDYTTLFVASDLNQALIWVSTQIDNGELDTLEAEASEGVSITYYIYRQIINVDTINGGHEFIAWVTSDGGFHQEVHPHL